MRASRSTTPKNAKSKQEVKSTEKTSAKKLVQARLPFKIIAPGITKEVTAGCDHESPAKEETIVKPRKEETKDTSSSAIKKTTDARKRKLSNKADESIGEENDSISRRSSGSKENLTVAMKKKKTNDELEEGIVLLIDSEDDGDIGQKQQHQSIETTKMFAEKPNASPKTPAGKNKVTPKGKLKQSANTPQSGSKTPTSATKLQIKFPFTGSAKNKRRQLKRKSNSIQKEETHADESYDEIEIIAEELNPQKRVKKLNNNSEADGNDNIKKAVEIAETTIDLESDNEDQDNAEDNDQSDKKSELKEGSLTSAEKSVSSQKNAIESKTKKSVKQDTKADTKRTAETAAANVDKPTVKSVKAKTDEQKNTPVKSTETDTAITEKLDDAKKKEIVKSVKAKTVEKNNTPVKRTETEAVKPENLDDAKKKETVKSNNVENVQMECTEEPNQNLNDSDTNVIAASSENESHETTNDGDDDCTDKPCMSPKTSESKVTTIAAANVTNTPVHSTKDVQKKVLTPKQQKLIEQRRKIREEKERKLQEERLQKQREKEEKEQARKRERDEKEEQRRKEREEKEELKRKEREEKEQKRLAESEVKNEEKRKKEEERKRKEQEKEEIEMKKRKEKEEVEQKKRKEIAAFSKFFVPKATRASLSAAAKTSETNTAAKGGDEETMLAFRPFQIKGDMKLAPHCRKVLSLEAHKELDAFVGGNQKHNNSSEHSKTGLYLANLRAGKIQPVKWRRPTEDTKNNTNDDDVMIVEDELERAAEAIVEEAHGPVEHHRAKFYKFRENRRPAYYGTWRKKTNIITARRPFAQDKKYFDYEIDSDLEWEEEEPGESLDGSDDDKEKESEDEDYEVDNEWFVPHGHLSDEEIQNEDECGLGDDNDREAQKAKLKLLQQEFAQEMKKKTEKIKPRLIGCIWVDENGNQPELCPKIIWVTLNKCAMLYLEPPLMEEPEVPEKPEPGSPSTSGAEKTSDKLKPLALTKKLEMALLRLVHGNQHSKNFLINEFIAYVEANEPAIKNGEMRGPLKSTIREKIEEFAEWQVTEINNNNKNKKKKVKKRLCWIARPEVLKRMDMENLSLSNKWEYTLQPKYSNTNKEDKPIVEGELENTTEEAAAIAESGLETESNGTETKRSDKKDKITKYTKVLTTEEKAKQLQKQRKSLETKEKLSIKQNSSSDVAKPAQRRSAAKDTSTTLNNAAAATPAVKKRVPLLMSVARGQQIPTPAKNALISKFLKTTADAKSKAISASDEHIVDDDVVMLD